MTDLVVGADIGGTSTRVGVADLGGGILSLATGGPGNPNSVGVAESAAQISAVVDSALATVAGTVVAVVIGLAGGSRAATDKSFLRHALPEHLAVRPVLVSDVTVAFCSATPATAGYAVVAGTGAVAGHVVDDELVEQRDGWGWLLGDDGSGFWLGRAAVRATLHTLQRELPLGALQRAVLVAAEASDYAGLLQNCYRATPTWVAQFAPLVTVHAERDPVAAAIADQAADLLAEAVLSLDPVPDEPIVLGGSVLTTSGPVSRGFRTRIAARLPNTLLRSTSGVIGALWIGTRARVLNEPAVHARLVATAEGLL
ncbi:MAG: N-acetylglucosamine kinase [Propionibacteriaceae bacterium]|nr:N-acetylglucosamine kinase [Propionibacteriaceae bacterium]